MYSTPTRAPAPFQPLRPHHQTFFDRSFGYRSITFVRTSTLEKGASLPVVSHNRPVPRSVRARASASGAPSFVPTRRLRLTLFLTASSGLLATDLTTELILALAFVRSAHSWRRSGCQSMFCYFEARHQCEYTRRWWWWRHL